jgi:hypothetical protein
MSEKNELVEAVDNALVAADDALNKRLDELAVYVDDSGRASSGGGAGGLRKSFNGRIKKEFGRGRDEMTTSMRMTVMALQGVGNDLLDKLMQDGASRDYIKRQLRELPPKWANLYFESVKDE